MSIAWIFSPEDIQEDDGFVAWNPNGKGTVIQHVKGELGNVDSWISTTTDYNVAKGKARSETWKMPY